MENIIFCYNLRQGNDLCTPEGMATEDLQESGGEGQPKKQPVVRVLPDVYDLMLAQLERLRQEEQLEKTPAQMVSAAVLAFIKRPLKEQLEAIWAIEKEADTHPMRLKRRTAGKLQDARRQPQQEPPAQRRKAAGKG